MISLKAWLRLAPEILVVLGMGVMIGGVLARVERDPKKIRWSYRTTKAPYFSLTRNPASSKSRSNSSTKRLISEMSALRTAPGRTALPRDPIPRPVMI